MRLDLLLAIVQFRTRMKLLAIGFLVPAICWVAAALASEVASRSLPTKAVDLLAEVVS